MPFVLLFLCFHMTFVSLKTLSRLYVLNKAHSSCLLEQKIIILSIMSLSYCPAYNNYLLFFLNYVRVFFNEFD
jgi:hypothetical protein